MGFLDKLFGNNGSDIVNKLKEAADVVAKEVENAAKAASESIANSDSSSQAGNSRPASAGSSVSQPSGSSSSAESGFSWGPAMPEEENQYNYPGSYEQYFLSVFTENFPAYRISHETVRKGKATVFTFWSGEQKALVVELMSENSSAQRIRSECERSGIPYLRFYYNHFGWWNTKAYVLQRTRNALKL